MLLLFGTGTYAQYFAGLTKAIYANTTGFDSAIFFYTESPWPEPSINVEGYGVKNNEVIRLSMTYRDDTIYTNDSSNSLGISRRPAANTISALTAIRFSSLFTLHEDDIRARCPGGGGVYDARTYFLMVIKDNKYCTVRGSAPEYYQEHCPNKDRGIFIDVKTKIEKLLKSSN